jgi:hypothetical protein
VVLQDLDDLRLSEEKVHRAGPRAAVSTNGAVEFRR